MAAYVMGDEQLPELRPVGAYRLLGMFMTSPPLEDFADFKAKLFSEHADPALERIGRRCLILAGPSSIARYELEKSNQDAENYTKAVEFWREQSAAFEKDGEYWRDRSESFESWHRRLSEAPLIAQALGVRRWIRNRRVG
jgi:hypothetical protein